MKVSELSMQWLLASQRMASRTTSREERQWESSISAALNLHAQTVRLRKP